MSTHTSRRPGSAASDATPVALIGLYQQHLLLAVVARTRRIHPGRADDAAVEHALAALSIGAALVSDLHEERWPIVRDALGQGAELSAVADAMDLEPEEVVAGLAFWADRHTDGNP